MKTKSKGGRNWRDRRKKENFTRFFHKPFVVYIVIIILSRKIFSILLYIFYTRGQLD